MIEVNADELPRLLACNGSRLMSGFIPDMSEQHEQTREEGIAAHWVAATVSSGKIGEISELVDRKAPNGVYVTADMIDNVDGYLTMIAERGVPANMELDTSFQIGNVSVRARCDNYQFANGRLFVDDFKYGYSIVEPESNWTLLSHAFGVVTRTQQVVNEIVFTIFQPRPFHPDGRIRQWVISYNELLQLYGRLNEKLNNLNNELHTNPYCGKCHATARCEASRKAGNNAIDASAMAHDEDLPNEEISYELDNLTRARDAIKARLDALENLARHKLKHGSPIDNYSLFPSFGNLSWLSDIDANLIRTVTGIDIVKPGLITPTQAIKKKFPEALLPLFTERRSNGVKMVRQSTDKLAARLFGKPQERL